MSGTDAGTLGISTEQTKGRVANRDVLLHEVTGAGEPIVPVPGGLSGRLSWIPHAERLAADRMVVRVQLRSVELAEAGEPYSADYGTLTEREALCATVDDLVATVPHGRLLELPGGHACHIQNIDRFLQELARHTSMTSA